MTQAAKLKTAVRARAAKTGESYTAARRQVLALKPATRVLPFVKREAEAPAPSPIVSSQMAKDPRVPRGELSDRTARKSTGHGLEHWFEVLDKFGKKNGHTKAAEYLYAEHKVQGWHAQMITVTWERARGLRQENQSCTGTFQVSVSRTINAPIGRVAELLNDAKARGACLKSASPALAKALDEAFAQGKSMEIKKPDYARMRYKWLSSVVELRLYGKAGKVSLVADSSDLPDSDAVKVRREAFSAALDFLREAAESGSANARPSFAP